MRGKIVRYIDTVGRQWLLKKNSNFNVYVHIYIRIIKYDTF